MIFKPSIVGMLDWNIQNGKEEVFHQESCKNLYLNSIQIHSIEPYNSVDHPEVNSILRYAMGANVLNYACRDSVQGLVGLANFGHTEVGKLLYET